MRDCLGNLPIASPDGDPGLPRYVRLRPHPDAYAAAARGWTRAAQLLTDTLPDAHFTVAQAWSDQPTFRHVR
jgi:hypothetical protein